MDTKPEPHTSRLAALRRKLATYVDRYGAKIDAGIEQLERSAARRTHRMQFLRTQIDAMQRELQVLEAEVAGFEKGLELLIGGAVETLEERYGEGWSPVPVLGYRLWAITDDGVHGAKQQWSEPSMTATCLTTSSRREIPHSDGRCGRLGCGVYAAKDAGELVGGPFGSWHRTMGLGLVELTGKVVEHERGYRAAGARVVAVAIIGRRRFATDDMKEIEALFADPMKTLRGIPAGQGLTKEEAVEYVAERARSRSPWTSVNSSE